MAGPPSRPSTEPVTVQRRASNTGVIMVAGQKIALGRIHAGQVVTVHVAAETITIDLAGEDTRTLRRTTAQPVRSIKDSSPASACREPRDEAASSRTGGPPPAMLDICQEICPARLATRGSHSAWNSGS
jgi:hypothetical protein